MPPLSARDLRRVDELQATLATFREGDPPVLSRMPAALLELLNVPVAVAYRVVPDAHGLTTDFVYQTGIARSDRTIRSSFAQTAERMRYRFGFYDARGVEPRQRNRVHALPSLRGVLDKPQSTASKLGVRCDEELQRAAEDVYALGQSIGIADYFQVRALVCDGPMLLSWVGGFSPEPATTQQRRLLGAIVPALRRRLGLEESLGRAALHAAALPATLEAIGRPAWVVDRSGRVVVTNAAGRAALAHGGADLASALRHAAAGRPGERFASSALCGPGFGRHCLLVEKASRDPSARVAAAAHHYGLTPREREVLDLVARGRTNKAIAAALGCAERTTEVHVSRLLHKLEAENRAQLVARVWQLTP